MHPHRRLSACLRCSACSIHWNSFQKDPSVASCQKCPQGRKKRKSQSTLPQNRMVHCRRVHESASEIGSMPTLFSVLDSLEQLPERSECRVLPKVPPRSQKKKKSKYVATKPYGALQASACIRIVGCQHAYVVQRARFIGTASRKIRVSRLAKSATKV